MGKTAAERKRLSRLKQTDEKRKLERMKAAEGMRKYRQLKKNVKTYQKKENEAAKLRMRKLRERLKKRTEDESQSSARLLFPFASRQSYGKARKKAISALPHSPRKRELIKRIAEDIGLIISPKTQNIRSTAIDQESINAVTEFYLQSHISRELPGKKDIVVVRNKETNKKEKLQKHLLMFSLKETWIIFKEENPEMKIGLSKFCELRPKQVLLVSSKDHKVCCCVYCENLEIIMSISEQWKCRIRTLKQLISLLVCDTTSSACMNQQCLKCKDKIENFISENLILTHGEEVTFNQWKDGKLEPHTFTGVQMIILIHKQMVKILAHFYNIFRQAKELKKQKRELKPGCVILQTDFSENYAIKHQNEIMQAHWTNNSTVTIYTAILYFRDSENSELNMQSYVVISDTLRHSATEVNIFNSKILADFHAYYGNSNTIMEVKIWTDGAAAHFKNRSSMMTFASSSIYSEWNFFESYHGKGPHDGIGGAVKRKIWKKVLQGQITIRNAEEFFIECDKNKEENKIRCLYVTEEEIMKEQSDKLEELFKNIKPVKGIQTARSVVKTGPLEISLFKNTGDSEPIGPPITLKHHDSINVSDEPADVNRIVLKLKRISPTHYTVFA